MKKIDTFFIVIVFLVTALTGVYYYSYKSLNYFETNPVLKARYERKKNLLSLAKKLEDVAAANSTGKRNIASISEDAREPELIIENNINANELAKKYYLDAKIKCYEPNKEIDCMSTIEVAVTHFPESNWTAESLVLLTEFYYRTKRMAQAREILEILKQDFKHERSIQEKVGVIERHLL